MPSWIPESDWEGLVDWWKLQRWGFSFLWEEKGPQHSTLVNNVVYINIPPKIAIIVIYSFLAWGGPTWLYNRVPSHTFFTTIAILRECACGVFLLIICDKQSFESLRIQSAISCPPKVKKHSQRKKILKEFFRFIGCAWLWELPSSFVRTTFCENCSKTTKRGVTPPSQGTASH